VRVTNANLTIGPSGPETIFNILPVFAPPGKPNKEYDRYAFYFKRPPDWETGDPWEARWVAWDPNKGNTTLSPNLRDRCLVKLKGKKTIQVIFTVDPADEKTWKLLVMKMKLLKPWDLAILKKPGDFRDTSEICIEPFEGGKPKLVCSLFTLRQYDLHISSTTNSHFTLVSSIRRSFNFLSRDTAIVILSENGYYRPSVLFVPCPFS
jgi:hypothetical protein